MLKKFEIGFLLNLILKSFLNTRSRIGIIVENRGGKNLRMIFLNVKKVKKFEIGSLNFELNLILKSF